MKEIKEQFRLLGTADFDRQVCTDVLYERYGKTQQVLDQRNKTSNEVRLLCTAELKPAEAEFIHNSRLAKSVGMSIEDLIRTIGELLFAGWKARYMANGDDRIANDENLCRRQLKSPTGMEVLFAGEELLVQTRESIFMASKVPVGTPMYMKGEEFMEICKQCAKAGWNGANRRILSAYN